MVKLAEPAEIRIILFDLDGTLRYNVPSYNETFFNLAAEMGMADSQQKRLSATRWVHYYWAQSPELVADMAQYETLSEDFWNYYWQRNLVRFGCSVEQAQGLAPEVLRRMREEYHPQDYVPPQVFETLQALKEAGFGMAVVSNRGTAFGEQLTRLGLDEYFSFALAAGEINSWKPDPGIFWHALERLEANPQQALYVGDNYYADVVGAQNAGLQAVLVDPEGIFPEAQCLVIRQVNELLALLK
ncbi:MAG TPA: HAD family hydrolase [Anaerolineales bacterium]|nr:HAD family hydrolase [Anaerolineales bacterium]